MVNAETLISVSECLTCHIALQFQDGEQVEGVKPLNWLRWETDLICLGRVTLE